MIAAPRAFKGRALSRTSLTREEIRAELSSALVLGNDPEGNHDGYERKSDGKEKIMHLILENRDVGL